MEFLDRIIPPELGVKETYQEVQNMMMEHERRIRPHELYMIKSKAIKFLMEILEVLTHCKGISCTVVAAITNLNIGILQADLEGIKPTTELAKESFKKCIDLLEESKLTSEGILPAISANIQLGRIYMRWYLHEEAEDCLKQAEYLYVKFKSDIQLDPVHMVTIMGIKEIEGDDCPRSILEKLHLLTLSYFVQVYHSWNNRYSLALYQHKMLSRQWSQNRLTHDLDYVAWAHTATRISQYFLEENKFPQAQHHLAAASCILEKYFEILKAKGSREMSESIAAEYEDYDQESASIARCWAEYGIALLRKSKERLLMGVEEEDGDLKPTETLDKLRFVDLEPELGWITNNITDMYLLDSNDAGPVILNVRKWLDKAQKYYTFENTSWYYVYIAKELCDAYKYLLFFEDDEDRQAEIHKQRIVILEEINEKFYSNKHTSNDTAWKIWIDLAETYTTIRDLEVNCRTKKSIKYYQKYQESLNKLKNSRVYFDEWLHPELHSYFRVGKLYNEIISSDVQQKIENTQNSLKAYSVIVDYYNNNPEKQKELDKWDFVEFSKEYVTSLSLTLDRYKLQQITLDKAKQQQKNQ